MITLDDYFSFKEVLKITKRTKVYYDHNFKSETIIIRHTKYIKRSVIEYKYREQLTDLFNLIPLRHFSEHVGLSKGTLEKRIDFMKRHNTLDIFEYREIENILYIVVDEEMKGLLKEYTPFVVSINNDYSQYDIKKIKTFADFAIGFY